VDEEAKKRRSMQQVRAHLARADSELEAAQRHFDHAPTRSLRWPWCAVANARTLIGDHWRWSERGYGSERRGRSNLRDALPLASHPGGVGSAGGVVCHLLDSAAVTVRTGGAPQCLRLPWREYASKSTTCPAAPAEEC
jgi:hypothetical protein